MAFVSFVCCSCLLMMAASLLWILLKVLIDGVLLCIYDGCHFLVATDRY